MAGMLAQRMPNFYLFVAQTCLASSDAPRTSRKDDSVDTNPHNMNEGRATATIRIAAALIDDGAGRLLLVRKAGARCFMLAGGKIEDGETPLHALLRELEEEIGLSLPGGEARHLGRFSAPAANEPDHIVEAEIFHARVRHAPQTRAEIEEAVWVDHLEAAAMPLAPLARDHILPLARTL